MAATIKQLRETMLTVIPPVRRIEYETDSLTLKYCPEFKERFEEIDDFLARVTFAYENLPSPGDEVYPSLFIGGKHSIANTEWLKSAGITGIVNVAHGNGFAQYEPDYEPLKDLDIVYKGFSLGDFISADHDSTHESTMMAAVEAIDELIKKENAKIMVTCAAGISRSSSTVLCYLILKKDLSAYEALKMIRQSRDCFPSKQQLLYVAKVHNKKFGYENVDVVDVDMSMDKGRQKILKSVQKSNNSFKA